MEGTAVLCFPESGAWFQGYVNVDGASLGLMGVEVPVDDCVHCPHGGYREYNLTVINYEVDKELEIAVYKTGGESCTIASDDVGPSVHFDTSRLLVDSDAATAIEVLFPSIATAASSPEELSACVVCYGTMRLPHVALETMEPQP
ncbi:hypothetical protein SPRG_07052 [Saprolegnia parasitica CBS 223.65]|uniref:Uncharacterized protein n=1 Tax=Saprolegnia parasitica (strain CBS 223.65) TaxID=695850 RepID=A0A067CAC8_SAPPC|nr:hypothetical protein SPRG_07052 [Saprolegnia parasitica CBS 223.65]KDO27463.1 hypothetical protein SPRG_07052 [Saprolegnia parasitica CBS 223.65]|eukprot:XP_012201901.1 hypothetical protein SPRG_07052 [Saprolegnia parasitica CBS 223.65]